MHINTFHHIQNFISPYTPTETYIVLLWHAPAYHDARSIYLYVLAFNSCDKTLQHFVVSPGVAPLGKARFTPWEDICALASLNLV